LPASGSNPQPNAPPPPRIAERPLPDFAWKPTEENPLMENRTVLQVIPALDTGGAERTTVDVAAAIVTAGGRAIVASAGGQLVPELIETGAVHIPMPLDSKNPLVMALNIKRLTALVREHRIDLLHARSRAPAWSALAAARITGRPFVTTYHGSYNQDSWIKGIYNSVMARADRVIANSHYIASLIRERNPFASDRITVIHRGSDLTAFEESQISRDRLASLKTDWGLLENDRVILNMARLTHWKGQTVLIDALKKLRDAGITNWVAILAGSDQGRTDYSKGLRAQIRAHGLEGQVRLVGHCSDVPAAMSLSDAVAVASIEPEAFGRAAIEAQAAGAPVVVTDIGAVHETVLAPPECSETLRTGWRVAPGDAEALAGALQTLLNLPPDDRRAIRSRARAHVAAHFSLKAMTDKTLCVYDTLLNPMPDPTGKDRS